MKINNKGLFFFIFLILLFNSKGSSDNDLIFVLKKIQEADSCFTFHYNKKEVNLVYQAKNYHNEILLKKNSLSSIKSFNEKNKLNGFQLYFLNYKKSTYFNFEYFENDTKLEDYINLDIIKENLIYIDDSNTFLNLEVYDLINFNDSINSINIVNSDYNDFQFKNKCRIFSFKNEEANFLYEFNFDEKYKLIYIWKQEIINENLYSKVYYFLNNKLLFQLSLKNEFLNGSQKVFKNQMSHEFFYDNGYFVKGDEYFYKKSEKIEHLKIINNKIFLVFENNINFALSCYNKSLGFEINNRLTREPEANS